MKNIVRVLAIVIVIIVGLFILSREIGDKGVKNKKEIIERYKSDLINTDIEFYNVSQKSGTGRAFIDFADDSVVLLRQDSFPITCKSEVIKSYRGRESSVTPLRWTPVKAEVSTDGTLGYTYGNWEYTTKDISGKEETLYGNYVTIWKRQQDGKWKYVLDGGNTTPSPAEKNK